MEIEQKFKKIQEELRPYKKILGKAADAIIDENVSSYPIFVVHRLEVSIGIPIIKREEVEGNWSINASSLEELVTKKVIEMEKLDSFKGIYKNPRSFLCLLLLSDFGATFAFLPRS
ncbi:MAG TPA: hypothetical protein ENI82_03430 [Bacteroidetes bacterium]|nr:hypothetical protein [Bacteroidota bacterium]